MVLSVEGVLSVEREERRCFETHLRTVLKVMRAKIHGKVKKKIYIPFLAYFLLGYLVKTLMQRIHFVPCKLYSFEDEGEREGEKVRR